MMRWLLIALLPFACAAQTINVGSKRFTESYILGEIIAQTLRGAGDVRVVHQRGLGNTAIVFAALRSGSIDLYPEYTGTIAFELLGAKQAMSVDALRGALAAYGVGVDVPLGFNNTYALAVPSALAKRLALTRVSDLAKHPALRFGLTQEFLNRNDGWKALTTTYALPQNPRGLEHGLAYEALAAGQIDVIDVYATDAKIARYDVQLLEDDRHFFPSYDAVVLYRLDFRERFPAAWRALAALTGRIDSRRMAELNADVELRGRTFGEAASAFLVASGAAPEPQRRERRSFASVLFAPDLGRLTLEHLALVIGSLVPAVLIGVALGIWAARSGRAARVILAAVALMQTVPALALLAFLITLMGTIGTAPAIAALFLYALLPIVRNTATGLTDVAPPLRESAQALGLPGATRLRLIELPLASRTVLAGVKTSAVISVGTATIAAFIGAGGYGERIVAGLAVNDTRMLLAGAIPAALLALIVQWVFDALERWLVPRGLRLGNDSRVYD